MPTNETLRPYVPAILDLMFSLLERENEENVLVALRIIIELHKHYRPPLQPEIHSFLQFVKNKYKEIPTNLQKSLDPGSGVAPPDPANILPFVDRPGFACQTIITVTQPDGTKSQVSTCTPTKTL